MSSQTKKRSNEFSAVQSIISEDKNNFVLQSFIGLKEKFRNFMVKKTDLKY